MIAREEEENNRQKANLFDSSVSELLTASAAISLVPDLDSAWKRYDNLTNAQKAFVKSDIDRLFLLRKESHRLKEEDERDKKIAEDKANAKAVENFTFCSVTEFLNTKEFDDTSREYD